MREGGASVEWEGGRAPGRDQVGEGPGEEVMVICSSPVWAWLSQ